MRCAILKKAALDRRRRRGRLRAEPQSNREALDLVLEAIGKRGGLKAGRTSSRARRRIQRVCGTTALRLQEVGRADARSRSRWWRLYDDWAGNTRSSRSRTACAESDWDGWKALTERARRSRAAGRRRRVRDQSGDPEEGHRGRRRQRAAGEAESDRHRHGNARCDGDGAPAGYAT